MITEAVLNFLHGLAVALADFLHTALPVAPGWVSDAGSALSTVVALVPSQVRYFVPLQQILTASLAFLALRVVLGAIRLARRVLSLFTGGGGNA